MADDDDDGAYGTAAPDAPVSRADFERALRTLHAAHVGLRDTLLHLAARVVTLTDEMTRRLDGVEPRPAPAGTAPAPPEATVEDTVEARTPRTLGLIRAADLDASPRVELDESEDDKYAIEPVAIPCAELIPLCGARCCTFTFALSTADLDEGILRWDYAKPYLMARRASDGFCVHSDPASHACTVHAARPRVCRRYDCRRDPRIWVDFERRIPAPPGEIRDDAGDEAGDDAAPAAPPTEVDLLERVRKRTVAVFREAESLRARIAEPAPRRGPKP